jgi:hypothetical protein
VLAQKPTAQVPDLDLVGIEGAGVNDANASCLRTPCILEGERVVAFVDAGATTSFIAKSLVDKHNWSVVPQQGKIRQCLTGSSVPRIGMVESLSLENGNKCIRADFEVADLDGEESLIIGVDLFEALGYSVQNVPFTWPTIGTKGLKDDSGMSDLDVEEPTGVQSELPATVGPDGVAEEWRSVLRDNTNIPISARCLLPNSQVRIDTGDARPVWVRQYPVPEGRRAAVTTQVGEWARNGWTVRAPAGCE